MRLSRLTLGLEMKIYILLINKMGCQFSRNKYGHNVTSITSVNGILGINNRVRTQYTKKEGGDDNWYLGTIISCYSQGYVSIHYDDGDYSIVKGTYVYLVDNSNNNLFIPENIPIAYPIYN